MRHYAEQTRVSATATVEQIRKVILGAGARRFATDEGEGYAQIAFELHGRTIRFRLVFPAADDPEFTRTPAHGWTREPAKARALWEQACRQRWRALLLMVRAKLEAVASGIVSEESEFLPYVVLAGGQTVSEWVEEHGLLALGPQGDGERLRELPGVSRP